MHTMSLKTSVISTSLSSFVEKIIRIKFSGIKVMKIQLQNSMYTCEHFKSHMSRSLGARRKFTLSLNAHIETDGIKLLIHSSHLLHASAQNIRHVWLTNSSLECRIFPSKRLNNNRRMDSQRYFLFI